MHRSANGTHFVNTSIPDSEHMEISAPFIVDLTWNRQDAYEEARSCP